MLEQHRETEPAGRATPPQPSDESLITSKQLCELLGACSEMHIWRLLNGEKNQALAFPKPIKVNERNYWRLGAVPQWIREREAESQLPAKATRQSRTQSRALKITAKRPSRAP